MTRFVRPERLADALEIRGRQHASVLAGGTDLVLMRAGRFDHSDIVLDVKAIGELGGIARSSQETIIGACTSLDAIGRDPLFRHNAVSDGAILVGGWQTRCRATIGGNVCRASPAADTLCGLLVLNAAFELTSLGGRQVVNADGFFTGPGKTVLGSDEILTRIRLPDLKGKSSYIRFTYRRAMDLSVAGMAVYLEIVDGICVAARVAVGACGPTPLLVPQAAAALIGSGLDETAVANAADAVVAAVDPIDDVRGRREHRLHVLPVILRRNIAVIRERYAGR